MDFPAGNRAMPITVSQVARAPFYSWTQNAYKCHKMSAAYAQILHLIIACTWLLVTVNDHYDHAQFTGSNNWLFVCVNMIIHHNRPQRSYTYILESSDPALLQLLQPLSKRHNKSAPWVDFRSWARSLPLAFFWGWKWKGQGICFSSTEGMDLVNDWRELFVLEACCFPNVFFPSSAPSKVDMSAHGARLQNTFTAWTWLDSFIYFKSDVWQTIFVKSTQSSVLLNRSLPP